VIKRISILVRKDGIDHDAFTHHWHGVHGPLVAQLPDVMRYTQNHVVELLPDPDGRPAYDIDGIVELYFVDDAARQRAFAVPAAAQIWRDDKLIVVAAGEPGALDHIEPVARTLSGIGRCERNDVTEVVPRATLSRGPQPVSAFFHLWFAAPELVRPAGEALAAALRGPHIARLAIASVRERRIV
jgi:uncharacterized protein (TIGR02118 family)